MNKAEYALREFHEIDELADGHSPVHRFSALSKLAVTVAYLLVLLSFDQYDLSGVFTMAVYPYLLFAMSSLSFKTCMRKMKYIMPLVVFVGIFNPLLNRTPWIRTAGITISYGWLSFIVLALKGILTLSALFLLMGTTKIDAVCRALRKLHVPQTIVTLILLTYRYLTVLTEEVAVMTNAYHLRAPQQKGIAFPAWGSFLGQLILRSMDRAKELYASMKLRGYTGEFPDEAQKADPKSIYYTIVWIMIFILLRTVPVARIIGALVTGGPS